MSEKTILIASAIAISTANSYYHLKSDFKKDNYTEYVKSLKAKKTKRKKR